MSRRGRPVAMGPARHQGRLKDELRALKSLAPYLWPRDSREVFSRDPANIPPWFGLRTRTRTSIPTSSQM